MKTMRAQLTEGWPALWQDEETCMARAKGFLDMMDEFYPEWRNKG